MLIYGAFSRFTQQAPGHPRTDVVMHDAPGSDSWRRWLTNREQESNKYKQVTPEKKPDKIWQFASSNWQHAVDRTARCQNWAASRRHPATAYNDVRSHVYSPARITGKGGAVQTFLGRHDCDRWWHHLLAFWLQTNFLYWKPASHSASTIWGAPTRNHCFRPLIGQLSQNHHMKAGSSHEQHLLNIFLLFLH